MPWRGFEALPPYFGGKRRLCPRISTPDHAYRRQRCAGCKPFDLLRASSALPVMNEAGYAE